VQRGSKRAQARKAEAAAAERQVSVSSRYTLLYLALGALTFAAVLGNLLWKASHVYVYVAFSLIRRQRY